METEREKKVNEILKKLDEEDREHTHSYISELKELVEIDALTGIYNRRAFDRAIIREIKVADRHNQPVNMILLDIDNFKQINDSKGHAGGDKVLKAVAQSLFHGLRPEDMEYRLDEEKNVKLHKGLHRYGGEEFAVILENTDSMKALAVMERLRKKIKDECKVTISAGIAEYQGQPSKPRILDKDDYEEYCEEIAVKLIHTSDNALYEAKNTGKNKIVFKQ